MDTIQGVLIYQTQMMRNSSLGPYVSADFSPPEYIVIVNALFYASLGVMILAVFIAMLIKSWVREFDRGLRAMSLPEQRAKTREFRYLGLEYWKLPEMVAILPLLVQLSLLLFSIGLVLFLFHISKPSFGITMSIFGVGVLYYAITTSISVFVTSSPFHSPLSRALGKVYQHVHAYFCPGVDDFLSPEMNTTPETAPGRLRRRIQIFLKKWRPYLERDFVESITATTLDEVQLFTAMSALERIHESVPDSQDGETLQWSVWQVAGSPTFRIPPSFNLPSWILLKSDDEEFLSRLPPVMVVALVAFSLRAPNWWCVHFLATARRVLQPVNVSKSPWDQLVYVILNLVLERWGLSYELIRVESPNDVANISRWNELSVEECIWVLTTLSGCHSVGLVQRERPFFIGICLSMISEQASQRLVRSTHYIVLLDAVVTLLAMSCSPDRVSRSPDLVDRQEILTNGRQYPWLLLNLRNPELISKIIEDVPSSCHKQLISLLFLVLDGLIWQESELLAVLYFSIITAKGDFSLYASALTAVAPALGNVGLSVFGRMLVVPRTTDVVLDGTLWDSEEIIQDVLLQDYDDQLGASQHPDPNILAILLVLSKQLPSSRITELQDRNFKLKNPWLGLAARVIARLDDPGGSAIDMVSFNDRRVHNMFAALSLLRYSDGEVPSYTEALSMASFLEPWELAISALALKYYLRTILSYSDPLELPYHLSSAVRAVFNPIINCRWGGQFLVHLWTASKICL